MPLIAHASYLINLCAQEPEKLEKSRRAFLEELKRCDLLGISGLVIHPGAHGGKGEEWGIAAIADSLNYALDLFSPQVQILLETTAGQGTVIGSRFEQLKRIIDLVVPESNVGVCADTCHIFAAGYDIRSKEGWTDTLQRMDDSFGLDQVAVFHLNDSKKDFDSHRDRHAPIGEGFIGAKSFEILMQMERFKEIPGILEVPGGDAVFMENIKLLKRMRGSEY
jgi:deoxyribonuclease-4